jgi:anaerobic selenocysteine-containing dehydrogenase
VSRPDVAAEYPLILVTGGRHQPYYHSEHRQLERHRRRVPWPIAEVHPEAVGPLGIDDGDWIWIETPRGRIQQVCRVTEGILPRVVHVQHGWWFPEEEGAAPSLHGVWRSNSNVLTDDDPDRCNPISGGWPLRTLLCRIYRCEGGRRDG